jgi:hypothetical protein
MSCPACQRAPRRSFICCWRAKGIGFFWSTARLFRATPFRRSSSGYRAPPASSDGSFSTRPGQRTVPPAKSEWLADAIHEGFSGVRPLQEALSEYHPKRDEHLTPLYDLACGLATLGPPPPETQALYTALIRKKEQTNRLIGTSASSVPMTEFYSPENVAQIRSQAAAATTAATS